MAFYRGGKGILCWMGMEKEDRHSGAADETVHTSSCLEVAGIDEVAVRRMGFSMADRVEHLFGGTSGGDRYVATKLPVRDPGGIVVGYTWIIREHFSGDIGQGETGQDRCPSSSLSKAWNGHRVKTRRAWIGSVLVAGWMVAVQHAICPGGNQERCSAFSAPTGSQ